jgi:hypothetical protein
MMGNRDVFINCPFSKDYEPFFYAMVFIVIRCGFNPRCALESDDGGDNRFGKICRIIAECDLGIHDISKTELDRGTSLPRFNMPLELGLFLAAKKFGNSAQKRKKCIIFESKQYSYQKFMSDISGQDIHFHNKSATILFEKLTAWLRRETGDRDVPGGNATHAEYKVFKRDLPRLCKSAKLRAREMTFSDYCRFAEKWVAS